jgi:hypothetical protein
MKRQLIVYPLLFALFPVLALYSVNVAEVSPSQVIAPAAVVVGATVVLLGLAWVALRDIRKSALIVGIFLILCFSYGHVVNLVARNPDAGVGFFAAPYTGLAYLIFVVWIVIGGISTYLIWRVRTDFRKVTSVLNMVGVVLVIIPTVSITVKEVRGISRNVGTTEAIEVTLHNPEPLPDIYYIILDRYASANTLEEMYGFDNSEFIDYLSSKGFYVASESRANYLNTQTSLASSLNMRYLDDLDDCTGETSSDQSPVYAMMEDYVVWRLLKSAGYEFIHLGSWWEPTRENQYADININYRGQLPEFSMLLLRSTILEPVGTTLGLWGEPRKTQWERVRYEFARLAEIPSMDEPTFVFAHFLTPHPEYVFDRNGDFVPGDAVKKSLQEQYIDQLVATNKMVELLIDRLLAESDVPPVIILQADEGPYPREPYNWRWDELTEPERRQKMEILNAYYLPGVDNNLLYPSITPVNSFRVVFNLYFRTGLELLPDGCCF